MAFHSLLCRSSESWWLTSRVHCLDKRGLVKGGLCRLENKTRCVKEKETEEVFVWAGELPELPGRERGFREHL